MIVAVLSILLLLFAVTLYASSSLAPSILEVVLGHRRVEVEEMVENPTFVRRLDFEVLADVQVYTYLLDHPDLNAALARALGIAPYEVVRIGPGQYHGDDGGGNEGTIEVFRAEGNDRAFIERGVSSGWWFGEIGGRVVALVAFSTEEGVRGTVTVWAQIDQGVVDRLLRILKPMLGGLLDRKLREQFNIAVRVAEVSAQHAGQFCPLLETVSGGSPDERQALAGLAGCKRVDHQDTKS